MSKVVDNFLKYIAFDTQSAEDAASVPSTEKQFALAKLLVEQLKALGVKDVSMSEHCYVYGTIPATAETDCPVVGFLAHMDTSPDFSDENTRPQLIQNYNGGDIILNKNLGIKMSPEVFPALKNYVGKDLITTDGTSLLGGDDKAGIAEIPTEPSRSPLLPTKKWDTAWISSTYPAGAPMWLIQWTAEPSARWNTRPSTQLP